jgi:hypothetical protein
MVLNGPTSEIPQKPTDGISTDGTNNFKKKILCSDYSSRIATAILERWKKAELWLNTFTTIG